MSDHCTTDNSKRTITEQNFNRAMEMLAASDASRQYLAEKMASELRCWVGKQLSDEEWAQECVKAYNVVLKPMEGVTALLMRESISLEAVLLCTMWALP